MATNFANLTSPQPLSIFDTVLGNTTSGSQGAGAIGYSAAVSYTAGTIGAWANGLSGSTGALSISWTTTLTGGQTRTVSSTLEDDISLFDFMSDAQIADVQAGTALIDVSAVVQVAFNSARGKIIRMPKGKYLIATPPLVINTTLAGSARPFMLQGDGFDANGGNDGSFFYNPTGTTDTFQITNVGGADTEIVLQDFGVYGLGGATASAGNGITITNCANVKLRRLWVQGNGSAGVFLDRCYGSTLDDCIIFKNRIYGIWADKAFNLGSIHRCKVTNNGFVWSQGTANINISGSGNPNLGVTISGPTDVSYAGQAIPAYATTPTGIQVGLTNIVVAAGVATATTVAAHGRATGDKIFVTGATVSPLLNSIYAPTITVTGANTFTFATSAPNGTYTDATLRIGPYAVGMQINDTQGLIVNAYSENCYGLAAYVGVNVVSFEFIGGFWLGNDGGGGAAGSGLILTDDSSNGKFSAMRFQGPNAGIYCGQSVRPHGVDIQTSISLSSGASITYPQFPLVDGTYYGVAAPGAGTWTRGVGSQSYIKQLTPTIGQPTGFSLTATGTPGTWRSEANLA